MPAPQVERGKRPVFVIGCHRSGTNLLYDTLLSAGGFAIYRGYVPVYKMLIPRFGNLNRSENRRRLADTWLHSKGFRRSGLDAETLRARLHAEVRTGGDFLRIVMDTISRHQNSARWAVYDADNVLYIPQIKADIPEALFLHIVRDGRNVALSLRKMGGFRPFPWPRQAASLEATALYWRWMVRAGRQHGQQIPDDYLEVRYEELVSDPERTIATLGRFLEQKMDHDQIRNFSNSRASNSSFRDEPDGHPPMNRWKQRLSPQQVASLEGLVGDCLEEFGYSLTTPEAERTLGIRGHGLRAAYAAFLNAKLWLKGRSTLGRFADLSALELEDEGEAINAAD